MGRDDPSGPHRPGHPRPGPRAPAPPWGRSGTEEDRSPGDSGSEWRDRPVLRHPGPPGVRPFGRELPVQVQHVVGRTLGLGVALGTLLGIGALPASAAPVSPVRPGEVQIGEPLVIERDAPAGTERLSSPAADSGSDTTRMTAAAVVVGALVLG